MRALAVRVLHSWALTRTLCSKHAGLPDFLTRVAQREMQRVPNELCSRPPTSEHDPGCSGVVLSLSYIPKVGHVVRMQGPGTRPLCEELQRALPDYAFAFEGETDDGYGAYYFCDVTRELDEKFGDLFHRILGAPPNHITCIPARLLASLLLRQTWRARCCAT